MKTTKKLLSILLSVAMLLTVTAGLDITAFAEDYSIKVDETVTVSIPKNMCSYVKFTPEETGIYTFESFSDDYDPMGVLYKGEDIIAEGDDIVDEVDCNFAFSTYCEAGAEYTLEVSVYELKSVKIDVRVTEKYPVTNIVFTHVGDYEYYDGTYVYPDFNEGDTFEVFKSETESVKFVYDGYDFCCGEDYFIEEDFSVFPSLTPVFNDEDEDGDGDFANKMEVDFFTVDETFDVTVLEVPVKSISLKLAQPIRIVENTNGHTYYAGKNDVFFYYVLYEDEILTEGTVLTINYKDGTSEKYTCKLILADEDDPIYYFIDGDEFYYTVFVNKDGEYLDTDYLDSYDNQEEVHWTLGNKNYTFISYMNVECKVPVQIIKAGWQKFDGKWYYFDKDEGEKVTDWQKISGKWYYFDAKGVMQTGWQKINKKWYYLNKSGAMQTGWQKISGKWYYFDAKGVMQTGWQKINKKWYYFNSGGVMQTGWQKINKKWYYFNKSGVMQTGWLKSGGKWYYLKSDGSMAAGTSMKIGKKTYKFNSNGVCTNP